KLAHYAIRFILNFASYTHRGMGIRSSDEYSFGATKSIDKTVKRDIIIIHSVNADCVSCDFSLELQ
ncbi:MAG: hypothetical protein RR614_06265, partial [Eubacterium sp.]